jgi:hypothetical protein
MNILIVEDACSITAEHDPRIDTDPPTLNIFAESDDGGCTQVSIRLPTAALAKAYADAINGVGFECLDCGVNTSKISEYYVVHDEVWLKANPDRAGMLCIGCLETRLGRKLTPRDFDDAPINMPFPTMAPRLRDRLGVKEAGR